jgi:ribosomal protein S18 acetylase RimI-like enzyme
MKNIVLSFILALGTTAPLSAQAVLDSTHQEASWVLKPMDQSTIEQEHLIRDFEYLYLSFAPEVSQEKRSAGLAFLGSLVVPGLGQAAVNQQWIKTGVFVAIEGITVYAHFRNQNLGRDLERSYWEYVETGWSAAKYVKFLVDHNNFYYPGSPLSYNDLATPGSNLAAIINSGNYPANVRQEWPLIDLIKLRQLEARTLYGGTSGNAFSHFLPDYGSQQYYELVSKYFQFGPGWKDFNAAVNMVVWEKEGMSAAWLDGAAKSKRFNDRLRTARNMASIVFVNHAVAAFDGLFSARLHNHRLETAFSPLNGGTMHLNIRF